MDSCERTSAPALSWSNAPSLLNARYDLAALTLADGSVLVSGGVDSSDGYAIRSCERLAPGAGHWDGFPAFQDNRFGHAMGILSSGQCVVVGGDSGIAPVASVEITAGSIIGGIAPVITVDLPVGPVTTMPITLTLTASEPVTGLVPSNVHLVGATLDG